MLAITGHYISVEGVKTYYEQAGDERLPPMVCIHTAGRDNRQWHGLMEQLSSQYCMYALDMPGHAKSWPLPGNKCINDPNEFGRFIWSFIEARGIENPIVIGCSVGGNIVFEIAAEHSDKVRAIISLQGADYTPTITPQALEMITHPYINYPFSNLDFSETLIGRKCADAAKQFLIYSLFQFHPFANRGDLTAYTQFDVREKMHKVTCPVLMIRGTDDWIVTQHMVDATFERLTHVKSKKLIMMDGLGHFPHVEDPESLAPVLTSFIQECGI